MPERSSAAAPTPPGSERPPPGIASNGLVHELVLAALAGRRAAIDFARLVQKNGHQTYVHAASRDDCTNRAEGRPTPA